MKRLLLILLCLPLMTLAQQTYVPDDNFEQALIFQGFDNVLDNYVTTSNINTISYLDVSSLNISDLTGIEDFIDLSFLECHNNNLTSLDILNSLDLYDLDCYNNQLTSIDVSDITTLDELDCRNNNLTSLNVRNGNNTNFIVLKTTNNPNLTCIDVDDASWSTIDWVGSTFAFDPQHYFSNNCAIPFSWNCINGACIDPGNGNGQYSSLSNCQSVCNATGIDDKQTIKRKLKKITDMLGQETPHKRNTPLFYIYDDGTVEKRIVIE
tara:strand:- start:654 stop:1451 length:798 start_codon:yes stop_codon:yes gene_type:complete